MEDFVWTRDEPAPRGSELSRPAIVAAAVALADADGLDAVSLRKVGAALGAGPMRLYRFVATKEELLDLMVDAALAEVVAELSPESDWRPALRAHAVGIWAAVERHEWLADLLGRRPQLGPGALARLDAALTPVFAVAGIEAARGAVAAVDAYAIGAVRRAVAERRATRATGADEAAWQAAIGPYLTRVLRDGRHPAVSALVRDGTQLPPRAEFDDGLDLVLDGVAARLAAA